MEQAKEPVVSVVVRPYASALPLGTFAFGVGNVLFSCLSLHWIPASEARVVAIMLLSFAAPLEGIASIMAFLSRDTGAATALGIFSASWIVQGLELFQPNFAAPSPAGGIFLIMLALCLVILASVTFSGKPLLGAVIVVATFRSAGAAWMDFGGGATVAQVTAWVGLLVAVLAFYTGLGFLMEDVKQRSLPMTFRRGPAKSAMEGDLNDQLKRISREAGIRPQL